MNPARAETRKRRPQERAELTRQKILQAATRLFSERGYEGTTIRDIEIAAEVQRGLAAYHFADKDSLWKTSVAALFDLMDAHMDVRGEVLRDLPARERITFIVRTHVRFNAAHPELNRLIMQEGKQDTGRLHHIVEQHARPHMELLRGIALQGLPIAPEEFIHWYYLFIGASALIFTVGPEAKALFGTDINDDAVIDKHAQFLVDFLLSRTERE